MKEKLYLMISGAIFALIGLFHLLRLVFHWPAMVGIWTVPFTTSLIIILLTAVLAFWAFRLSRIVTS